ncbi:hypothetical protein JMG10_22490 [Nostoc ellipsosporum NOK]|nr:hypothetical protein [Nostoc ellipsosporum NOK]
MIRYFGICLILLALTFTFNAHAQLRQIAESEEFEEPESGQARILYLTNGTTAFIHATGKGKLTIRLYDKNYKLKTEQEISPSYGKLRGNIEQIFEMNGDIIITAMDAEKRTPVLYRLIIDANTAQLKDDKVIAQLDRVSMADAYGMIFGGVSLSTFQIRVSDDHAYYAVIGSETVDAGLGINISVYDKNHKEVTKTSVTIAKYYKYIELLDYTFDNSGNLFVTCGGFVSKKKKDEEVFLTFTKIEKGKKGNVEPKRITAPSDLRLTNGTIRYNPAVNKLIFLASLADSKSYTAYLNPATSKLESPFGSPLDSRFVAKMRDEVKMEDYDGQPQQLFLHTDGGFTVVFEKLIGTVNYTSRGAALVKTELGSIMVARYSKEGIPQQTYVIPKWYVLHDVLLSNFYQARQEFIATPLSRGNQFKRYGILPGEKKSYVLINDLPENAERVAEKKKVKTVTGVGECEAFAYPLTGDKAVPDRSAFIPVTGRENHIALFGASAIVPDQQMYVTMVVYKEGRKGNKARLTWLKYE